MEKSTKKRSDLLHLLENIDSSIQLYMEVMNEVSQRSLAMGIAMESITLSLKLRAMLERWKVYLPFHECRDVEFDKWGRLLEQRILSLNRVRQSDASKGYFYPKNKFWLDMSEKPLFIPRDTDKGLKQDVKAYVARVDERLDRLEVTTNAESDERKGVIDRLAMETLKEQYGDRFPTQWGEADEQHSNHDCMIKALEEFKELLFELHYFFHADKSDEQYLRLSLRLFERLCKEVEADVWDECNRWMVEWPKRLRQSKATEKREALMAELTEWEEHQGACKFSDYCDFVRLNPLEDPDFGQFLFIRRDRLETKEVTWLFEICLKIKWLNTFILTPLSVTSEGEEIASFSIEEQAIREELMELCELTQWQNGMTAERMKEGLSRMLDVHGTALDAQQRMLSKELWTLYRQRPKCRDREKSLQVTWLNFIGWCQRRQFIAGSSPALCRTFFPQAEEDAYKAIDKGRNQDVKSFERLTPLFEACLSICEE